MDEGSGQSIYELLTTLWKREKESEELVKLPEDFGRRVQEYIGSVKHHLKVSDKQSLSFELKRAELEAVTSLLNELFELRLRKILNLVLQERSPENLFDFESRIYLNLLESVKEYRRRIGELMVSVAYRDWREVKSSLTPVYFLKEHDRIIGSDRKTYGPFKPGDIAVLPSDNAKVLEIKNIARILRVLEPKLGEKND
ncbi:MAG TPA: DNA replication complex GINS family protein [Nitrososphaeria archaeon]|nr:MAG: hypothetical protein DRN68_02195 [Nitrososphaerota archaeon]HDJ67050.1 DNA replication complex GINS family protein [Nitrososphaeria archaeon]